MMDVSKPLSYRVTLERLSESQSRARAREHELTLNIKKGDGSAGRLLKETVHILSEGMPEGMQASGVANAMRDVPGVTDIHDLHVWTVDPGYVALSVHAVLADQAPSDTELVMAEFKRVLRDSFAIEHTTIQFECTRCCEPQACQPGHLSETLKTEEHLAGRAKQPVQQLTPIDK